MEHARANVSDIDLLGTTPLHIAVENDDRDVVIQLLAAGATRSALSMDGETPLAIAVVLRLGWVYVFTV